MDDVTVVRSGDASNAFSFGYANALLYSNIDGILYNEFKGSRRYSPLRRIFASRCIFFHESYSEIACASKMSMDEQRLAGSQRHLGAFLPAAQS